MTTQPVQITSAKAWEGYVKSYLTGIPDAVYLVPFHLAWMQAESGGNPAAIGANGAKGPDGYPREIGLYQLFNPDDFQGTGVTPQMLRAYCKPSLYRPEAEQLIRPLTEQEKKTQIVMGAHLITKCRGKAGSTLLANGADLGWDKSRQDYWRLVKLYHALPGLVKAFGAVKKKLGRAPAGWVEFRKTLEGLTAIELNDSATWGYRSDWPRLLDNAESTGGAVPERTVS